MLQRPFKTDQLPDECVVLGMRIVPMPLLHDCVEAMVRVENILSRFGKYHAAFLYAWTADENHQRFDSL